MYLYQDVCLLSLPVVQTGNMEVILAAKKPEDDLFPAHSGILHKKTKDLKGEFGV